MYFFRSHLEVRNHHCLDVQKKDRSSWLPKHIACTHLCVSQLCLTAPLLKNIFPPIYAREPSLLCRLTHAHRELGLPTFHLGGTPCKSIWPLDKATWMESRQWPEAQKANMELSSLPFCTPPNHLTWCAQINRMIPGINRNIPKPPAYTLRLSFYSAYP